MCVVTQRSFSIVIGVTKDTYCGFQLNPTNTNYSTSDGGTQQYFILHIFTLSFCYTVDKIMNIATDLTVVIVPGD